MGRPIRDERSDHVRSGQSVGIVGRLVGSRTSWSGIPTGLGGGLTALGHHSIYLSAEPSPRMDRLVQRWLALTNRMDTSWAQTPEMMVLRSTLVRLRRVRRSARRRTEFWVQMGSEFGHPLPHFVTFDDMTVPQAVKLPDYVPMRPAVVDAWTRRQKEIYRAASVCCVASHWASSGLVDLGIDPGKIRVAGFGCNLLVDATQRDWSTPRFLFVGLGWKRKNGDRVLSAFDQLRQYRPDASLALVGDHPRVDRPGVTGFGPLKLDVPGERARLEDLFRTSTCLVVPSTYEPFGIVYAEAGWAHMPSIGTAIGGAADAIGAGGVVVDPYDTSALHAAMSALANPYVAQNLGESARARAELLTWPLVARRVATALGLMGSDPEPPLPMGQPVALESL